MKKDRFLKINLTLIVTMILMLSTFTFQVSSDPNTQIYTDPATIEEGSEFNILGSQTVPPIESGMTNVIAFDISNGQYTSDVNSFITDLQALGYTVAYVDINSEGIPNNVEKLIILGASDGSYLSEEYTITEGEMIRDWVAAGGELMVLSDNTDIGDDTANICIQFGVTPQGDMVTDSDENDGAPSHPIYSGANLYSHPILTGVESVKFSSGCSLDASSDVIIRTDNDGSASPSDAPVAVAKEWGDGRVAIFGDYDWLIDGYYDINQEDNVIMAINTILWLNGLEIEISINAGIEYLLSQQDYPGSGKWGTGYYSVATTAFVLIKLQDRAYELGMNPFETDDLEPDYCPWAVNIIAGWDYVFDYMYTYDIDIQNAGDPDTTGNGIGIFFLSPDSAHSNRPPYETGVVLMALAASHTPDRENENGADNLNPAGADTYGQIAQEAVDYLAFAQQDLPIGQQGGWHYGPFDDAAGESDNSVAGYTVLGLAAAEDFGCTVPSFVKSELSVWIDFVQNDVDGDADDGGSGYNSPTYIVNLLKTGNLIFQMTFAGDTQSAPRFMDAIDYIEAHWEDTNNNPGWGYMQDPAYYQVMYCLMKGLVYSSVVLLDVDGDTTPEHDWFAEFVDVILAQQQPDGLWLQATGSHIHGSTLLATVWALLVLEQITPEPPPQVEVTKHFTHTDVEFTPYDWEPVEIYLEDFEGDCPPVGWTVYETPANGDTWICSSSVPSWGYVGGTSGNFMIFDDDVLLTGNDNPWEELITGPIDCSIYRNIELDFDGDFQDMAGEGWFRVEVSNDGGATWWIVFFVTEDVGGFDIHPSLPLDISAFADFESDVRIKFIYSDQDDSGTSGWAWGAYVDNIQVIGEHYVLQPAELGTPLDSVDVVVRGKGKNHDLVVKSTNPGQLYGVITITGSIQEYAIWDLFDEEFNVNPAKIHGGVEVIVVDPDGYATVITDTIMDGGVRNELSDAWLYGILSEPLAPGYRLMVYIKFQTSMKHDPYTGDDIFWNEGHFYNDLDDLWDFPFLDFYAELPINLKTK